MNWTLIIKPLEKDYEIIELRTTTLESSLNPLDERIKKALAKQTPNRRNTTSYEWNIFEECVMAWIISPESWKLMCDINAERIRHLWWMEDSPSKKDLEFLLYKLDNYVPLQIAEKYYAGKIISCQNSLKKFIECGKYLVILTGTSDLLMNDWSIRDIKYYWNKFWDDKAREHSIINMRNFEDSRLSWKKQRYMYPRLMSSGKKNNISFFYDVYPKTKNQNDPLKREVIEAEAHIDQVETQIKYDIISYFRACELTWTKPWCKIE